MPMTFTGAGWSNWTGQWAPGTLAGTKDPNPPIALNNAPITLVQTDKHVNQQTFRDHVVTGWQARTLLQAFTYNAYVGTSLDGLDAFGNVDSITTSFDSDVWGTPQTFYGPTVTSVTSLTVLPTKLTNAQTFFAPTIRRTLKPAILTNSQTFFSPLLKATIKPSLLANSQAFFAPKITVTLKPALLADGDTFFSPKLLATVKPAALTNAQSFFAPLIRRTLKPTNLTNAQAFFGPTLRMTVKPTLLVDADSLFSPLIRSTVKPSLLVNSQTFFSAKLLMTLKPTLLSDGDTFYTHTVTIAAAGTVNPNLHVNTQTFFSPRIAVTLKPAALTNAQTLFSPRLSRTLKPALATNTQSFFSPKLLIRISPSAYANSQTFRAVTVSAGSIVPPLYVNSQQFYGPTITGATVRREVMWPELRRRKTRSEEQAERPVVVPETDQDKPKRKKWARGDFRDALTEALGPLPELAPEPALEHPGLPAIGRNEILAAQLLQKRLRDDEEAMALIMAML